MTGGDAGAIDGFKATSQKQSAAEEATLREAPPPSTPLSRPSRPTIHARQSSFAKRHASLDTAREVPLLKDWTNPSIVSQEAYPFPSTNQPLSDSPTPSSPPSVATPSISAPRSTSTSSEDSTTSLPTLHPILTHVSELPGWLQLQDPHENSPLLFSDLEADEFPTKSMLACDRPPSSYIPPPHSSPPLPVFELSPMPSRAKLRTVHSNVPHNQQSSGLVKPFLEGENAKNPNFYETLTPTTAISQPMPLQPKRVSPSSQPNPTMSGKRLSVGTRASQAAEKKVQPPSSSQHNAQLKSCLKSTTTSQSTTVATGASQPTSPASPSREIQQYLNSFVRSKALASREEDPMPPSPPRILSTKHRIVPDLPVSPKNFQDTNRLQSEKNTDTIISNRHSASSAIDTKAPYEQFLAASGAPPPPDSAIGRDIVVETKEKSYEIVVKLEGVGVEGITLTTRRPRTLLLSADYHHPTQGGHFERRIAFGSDADLVGKNGAGVKAEFDGVWLRVIVPRMANRKERGKGSGNIHNNADIVGRRNTVSH